VGWWGKKKKNTVIIIKRKVTSEPSIDNNTRGGEIRYGSVAFLSRLTTRRAWDLFLGVLPRWKEGIEGWIKALFAFCSSTKYRLVLLVAYRYFEYGVDGRKGG